MRRDINLIESGELASQRTSTNTVQIIIALAITIIIALMSFMFFTAIATKNELLSQKDYYEQDMDNIDKLTQIAEYNKLNVLYMTLISEGLVANGITATSELGNKISANIIHTIFDSVQKFESAEIQIESFILEDSNIICALTMTKSQPDKYIYEEFVKYMDNAKTNLLFNSITSEIISDEEPEIMFIMTFSIGGQSNENN